MDHNRSVFVLKIPPRQTLREANLDENGRTIGVSIRYHATLGLHNLDFQDIPGNIETDNFSTISLLPGIEWEIPVSHRWYLRPYLQAGWGTEFGDSFSAWIYSAGIKSRYRLGHSNGHWHLLSGLQFMVYNPSRETSDQVGTAMVGLEARQPLGRAHFRSEPLDLYWHVSYTTVLSDLSFAGHESAIEHIDGDLEFGVSVSRRNEPAVHWGLIRIDRVGMSYSVDPSGGFRSLRLNLTSWFDE